MAVKLTKNELKVQKDRLKQFQRYLPTLQLKKQQLQSVVMQVTAQLEKVEAERLKIVDGLDAAHAGRAARAGAALHRAAREPV